MDKKSSRVHSAGSPSHCNYHKEFPVIRTLSLSTSTCYLLYPQIGVELAGWTLGIQNHLLQDVDFHITLLCL